MTKETLKQCRIEGNVVKLPNIQLDRKEYMEVKKSLELIGGKWKGGKVAGFVFAKDPTDLLNQVANGEKRNLKKEFQFFATPKELARNLVYRAEIKSSHRFLEPSAGQGAIVNAIFEYIPNARQIDCCELMDINRTILNKIDGVLIIADDFLTLGSEFNNYYDRIIANPPFSKNQDIDHIKKMYDVCKRGGIIVTIASNHWVNSTNIKEIEFRDWLYQLNHKITDIDNGSFKESGTMVGGKIIIIYK